MNFFYKILILSFVAISLHLQAALNLRIRNRSIKPFTIDIQWHAFASAAEVRQLPDTEKKQFLIPGKSVDLISRPEMEDGFYLIDLYEGGGIHTLIFMGTYAAHLLSPENTLRIIPTKGSYSISIDQTKLLPLLQTTEVDWEAPAAEEISEKWEVV